MEYIDKLGNTLADGSIVAIPYIGKNMYDNKVKLIIGVFQEGKVYYHNKEKKNTSFIYLSSRNVMENREFIRLDDSLANKLPDLYRIKKELQIKKGKQA